jgi:hypothetical protein
MLATRHLLPLMRDVDYTAGLHTMGAPCRLAVNLLRASANRGGWDVTFVKAKRKECKILAGKYFRTETTWWTWENMVR